jgi:SAM-dependent methyltransferase
MSWWQDFFDETYLELWSPLHPPERCEADAEALIELMGIAGGDRVLDAPCGYGRIALPLAKRGVQVTGVDYSEDLLRFAKQSCQDAGLTQVDFLRGDLRKLRLQPEFQAAINLFSSIGYGSEEDDVCVLRNIYEALAPGGRFFLETMHRDAIVSLRARGEVTGLRGPDGITMREKNRFDPVTSRMHSTWTWNSPTRSGSRRSEMRIYSATELVSLLLRTGFAEVECRVGISSLPFTEETLDARLGLLCVKGA